MKGRGKDQLKEIKRRTKKRGEEKINKEKMKEREKRN